MTYLYQIPENQRWKYIADYWDCSGLITRKSDAKKEYEIYQKESPDCDPKQAAVLKEVYDHIEDYEHYEFTLDDFERYIDRLKESEDEAIND